MIFETPRSDRLPRNRSRPDRRARAWVVQHRRRVATHHGHWQNEFRCVTTSLLGYGGTAERRTEHDADIAHESEILEAVIRRAGTPVHLVGHSFGGLTALAVALRGHVPLLSLTIAEAPAMEILREAGAMQHYGAFQEMSGAYSGAFKDGDRRDRADGRLLWYGHFCRLAAARRDYAIETTPANLLDWKSAYGCASRLHHWRP